MNHSGDSVGSPSSDRIIIYQKPSCTTCRKVYDTLLEAGVDFESVDYFIDPIPPSKLSELLQKMNLNARDILRRKSELFRDLRLEEKDCTETELIELMSLNPDLMQRPIIERGSKAILARPADRIYEIL